MIYMRIFYVALFFNFSLAFIYASSEHHLLWKAPNLMASLQSKSYKNDLKTLAQEGYDIAGVDHKNGIIDLILDDSEYLDLKNKGYPISISMTKSLMRRLDEEYKNADEVEFILKEIQSKYDTITELKSIGKSVEGRNIWAIKISSNKTQLKYKKSSILFNSMHHAREVMTPEVTLDIVDFLTQNYGVDSRVTQWVDEFEIWVVPMLNPDGNHIVWTENNMWRKNTQGGHGVDLNRNYPYNWNSCRGSSSWRRSDTYRGPSAGSEPETQALMNLVSQIRPVFDISYHSFSEMVLYPFGCSPEKVANTDVVEEIGKEIANLLNYEAGTPWELLYNADGGDIDWMYGEYQVIPYVIELNSRSEGFQPDYHEHRDQTVELNRKGWMHLLERMNKEAIKGEVSHQLFSTYKNMSIEIVNLAGKKTPWHYQLYSENFHIVLAPGTYKLTLKADAKKLASQTITIETNDHLKYLTW